MPHLPDSTVKQTPNLLKKYSIDLQVQGILNSSQVGAEPACFGRCRRARLLRAGDGRPRVHEDLACLGWVLILSCPLLQVLLGKNSQPESPPSPLLASADDCCCPAACLPSAAGTLQVLLGKEGQPINLDTYGEQLLNSCELGGGSRRGAAVATRLPLAGCHARPHQPRLFHRHEASRRHALPPTPPPLVLCVFCSRRRQPGRADGASQCQLAAPQGHHRLHRLHICAAVLPPLDGAGGVGWRVGGVGGCGAGERGGGHKGCSGAC